MKQLNWKFMTHVGGWFVVETALIFLLYRFILWSAFEQFLTEASLSHIHKYGIEQAWWIINTGTLLGFTMMVLIAALTSWAAYLPDETNTSHP